LQHNVTIWCPVKLPGYRSIGGAESPWAVPPAFLEKRSLLAVATGPLRKRSRLFGGQPPRAFAAHAPSRGPARLESAATLILARPQRCREPASRKHRCDQSRSRARRARLLVVFYRRRLDRKSGRHAPAGLVHAHASNSPAQFFSRMPSQIKLLN